MMNGFLFNVANFITNAGGVIGLGTDGEKPEIKAEKWMENIVKPLQTIVLSILWPILFVLSVVGILYVVTLGVQYAKAESTDKREAAKSRMVNAIVGIVIMLVLIIVMLLIANNLGLIINWVSGFADNVEDPRGGQ